MKQTNPRHFMTTDDYTLEELEEILGLAHKLKKSPQATLKGKSLYLMFFNPSLRTRSSFQTGMYQLGGSSVELQVGGGIYNIELEEGKPMLGGNAEHVKEAARVMGRYADAIGIRCNELGTTSASTAQTNSWETAKQERVFTAFMKYAGVPIINMESNLYHPCQALADIMTVQEKSSKLAGQKFLLTWTYHPKALPTATANSAALIASRFGMDLTILRPKGYDLDPEIMQKIHRYAGEMNSQVTLTDDTESAFEGANFVYAKSWGSLDYYGQWDSEKLIRNKYVDWQVTQKKMDLTSNAYFMNCLPVRRNVEVSDEVIDSSRSIVIDEAENRLHAQKGLLTYLLQD